MSRLDAALQALETAVAELSVAVETAAEEKAVKMNGQAKGQSDDRNHHIDEQELRAMKTELHEAMTLLQAIQDVPQQKEGE